MQVQTLQDTRTRILQAADALFSERGPDATRTRDISRTAGVNNALVHYHFGSKEALYEAVLGEYYARLEGCLREAMSRGEDFEAQALAVVDAYGDFLSGHRSFARLVQRELAGGACAPIVVRHTALLLDLGQRWAGARAADGDRAMLASLFVTVYGAAVSWFTWGGVVGDALGFDPFSPEALALRKAHLRALVQTLLKGLSKEASV